jgi:Mn-dependent DtxR family transcriptional regulator
LSKNKITDENMVIQTEVIAKQVLNLNAYKVGEMLRKLEIAGLLTYQVTGKHRLRSWIVSADCSYE